MDRIPFDPSGAVTFDLSTGQVNLGQGPARVLVPPQELTALCVAAGQDATRRFGRAMGAQIAERMKQRLGTAPDALAQVTIESFVEHLSGEFGLMGLGVVGIERWGRALVCVVDHPGLSPAFTASVLEGALDATSGRKVACAQLMTAGTRTRMVVTSEPMALRVAAWLAQGASWGEVLVKLHAGGDSPQPRGEA
ncbi:MAG: hypothetical protein MUF54_06960 [Polyangiaceae bacterium]|jgi:hypothetical protein|nr:hypothetical protein [Polyangiaceae bacterium]